MHRRGAALAAMATLAASPGCVGDEPRSPLSDLGSVEAEILRPDGSTCTVCLWLADAPNERREGLMGITDLGGADGMAFVYDEDTSTRFWMGDTPLPLDIAFYDEAGQHVGGARMTPCPPGIAAQRCPRYGADAPFRTAIEVPAGQAPALGLVPGSSVALGAPCDPS